jgi:hypothetical protein
VQRWKGYGILPNRKSTGDFTARCKGNFAMRIPVLCIWVAHPMHRKSRKQDMFLYSYIPFDKGPKELSFGIKFDSKRVHNDRKVLPMNRGIRGSCGCRLSWVLRWPYDVVMWSNSRNLNKNQLLPFEWSMWKIKKLNLIVSWFQLLMVHFFISRFFHTCNNRKFNSIILLFKNRIFGFRLFDYFCGWGRGARGAGLV